MAEPLSDEHAERFAKALVTHGGNKSRAAVDCGYKPGPPARAAGMALSRNPAVLKQLQPLVLQQLSQLQPRAVQTLAGLLTNKSGYIRLEAAKDILNRMGVGAARDGSNTSPLLISIQIGDRSLSPVSGGSAPESLGHESSQLGPGGPKLASESSTRSPPHDFSEKVEGEKVSKVLDIETSQEDGSEDTWEL